MNFMGLRSRLYVKWHGDSKNVFAISVLFMLFLIDEMSDVLIFRSVAGTMMVV